MTHFAWPSQRDESIDTRIANLSHSGGSRFAAAFQRGSRLNCPPNLHAIMSSF
jgi:hypothetical protein